MRRGTAFCIVGTMGAEVKHTVYVIPSEHSESRNLPKWQVFSCGGSLSNVVDSSTPLRCGRNDIRFWFGRYKFKYPRFYQK